MFARACSELWRHTDWIGLDPLLQFPKNIFGVGSDWRRLGNRQVFERISIAGATLSQRVMDPGDCQSVLADPRQRAGYAPAGLDP